MALLVLIVVVGALLRWYRLGSILPGFPGDEAWTGLEARRILDEGGIGPWSPSGLGQPSGPLYWTAVLFMFFPDSLFTVRMSTAVLGVLTIPAFYLLARVLMDRKIALAVTALFTFSYWHIAYSRMAFNVASLPLIECLFLFVFFLGIKRSNIFLIGLSGAVFGLGIYTYSGFYFLVPAVVAFWLFRLWQGGASRGNILSHAVAFFILAMLVAIPYLNFLLNEPGKILSYRDNVSAFETEEYQNAEALSEKAGYLVKKGVRSLSMFFVGRDVDYTDGLGREALLDPAMGVLLVVGLLICLWKWREERSVIILLGLGFAVMGVALLTPGSWGENRRGISALPLVFLGIGIALEGVYLVWERWLRGRAFGLLVVAFIGFSAFWNVYYYFGPLTHDPLTKWIYSYDLVKALDHLKEDAPSDSYVYFYSGRWSYNYETRRFLLPDMPGEDRSLEFGGIVNMEKDPVHDNVVYLLMPPYLDLIGQIRERYPGGRYWQVEEGGIVLFSAYHVGSIGAK